MLKYDSAAAAPLRRTRSVAPAGSARMAWWQVYGSGTQPNR